MRKTVAMMIVMVCSWLSGCITLPTVEPLPCHSIGCMGYTYPPLPPPEKGEKPKVVGVIAPSHADGTVAHYSRVCGPSGCTMMRTPAPIIAVPEPKPPAVYWYQPPPRKVPTVITWGVWWP